MLWDILLGILFLSNWFHNKSTFAWFALQVSVGNKAGTTIDDNYENIKYEINRWVTYLGYVSLKPGHFEENL